MYRILCALFCLFWTAPAFGQALSVFGQSDGSLCYEQSRDGSSPEAALVTCTRALAGVMTDTERAYTHVNRSINHNLLGNFDDALADIEAAFDLVPELPEAYLSRGNTYYLQHHHADAIAEYTTALELEVSDAHKAYFNRALAYEELKEYEKAYRDFKSALQERSSFKPAQERIELYKTHFEGESWLS